MFVYAIQTDEDAGKRYSAAEAIARIDEISGRNIGRYIVTRAIPASANRYGRATAYVSKNGPGGFGVRRETAHPSTDSALIDPADYDENAEYQREIQ